jgi:hypothetical protein
MKLNIHKNIMEKLNYFHSIHKIPNIIFHGQSGCGKKTIVNDFIDIIYDKDKDKIKDYVMHVNCAHGKGIKFIRDELKFFAKSHIHSNGGDLFKSIILLNADKLTIDAQSALRRCIELFSHNTRFFIIIEDKFKLLKPILSRFCELYVPEPMIQGKCINLYKYNLNKTFQLQVKNKNRLDNLKKEIVKMQYWNQPKKLIDFSSNLYDKSYSALDIIEIIENDSKNLFPNLENKNELLFYFHKIRKEIRNEKILIYLIFHFINLKDDYSNFIEKISQI